VLYRFENYVLDADRRELRRAEAQQAVEPKVFDLLVHLIANRERVVSKDDLLVAVWNGRIVSESTLTSCINAARGAIGDSGEAQRLIKTLPRKGLRFVGDVQEDHGSHNPSQSAQPARERIAISEGSLTSVTPRVADKPSIAVLPFTNMSGDPEQEYFSDGITEDIITALSRLRWFFVIARNSTFAYKGQGVDVRQVGRDLGVRYLLEGSVRKSGQRLRITSQLLDATNASHIWSERYDRELTDIFALQDEITEKVAGAIEPQLVAAEGLRAEKRSTDDLDAWDLVARALLHFWKQTSDDSATAISILRQAVEKHPNYCPAHSLLAFALLLSAWMGWTPVASDRKFAAMLAHRAVWLDDGDPWAHLGLGLLAFTDRQTDEAVRHFQAALDLNPNSAVAVSLVAIALAFDGRSDEAMVRFEQALRMSPRDPFNALVFAGISTAQYMAGRYGDAVTWARKAMQLRPGILGAHRMLCVSLAQAGHIEESRAALASVRQLQPDFSIAWIKQSVPYTSDPMVRYLDGMQKAGLTE
jgi:TolB-like protein